jgi:hypothetical protein
MKHWKALTIPCAAAAALFAARGDVGAGGAIDVSGATLAVGDAPIVGSIVVDAAASLGNLPKLLRPAYDFQPPRWRAPDYRYPQAPAGQYELTYRHAGLGGADLRVSDDLEFAAGTYDFGSFTVDRGVTVRFLGEATVRATNSMRIDGRIVLEGAGDLTLDCSGPITFAGHDETAPTGLFTQNDDARILVVAGGELGVFADPGARVAFRSTGDDGQIVLVCDKRDIETVASIADADFHADEVIALATIYGRLRVANCTASGAPTTVHGPSVLGQAYFQSGVDDAVTVSGGSFAGLHVWSDQGLVVTDGAVVAGGAYAGFRARSGDVRIDGASSISAERGLDVTGEDVVIGDDCVLRTTGAQSEERIVVAGATLDLGSGAQVDDQTGAGVLLRARHDVNLSGVVRTTGSAWLESVEGGLFLHKGFDLDATSGVVSLLAAGAVTVDGGESRLSAKSYDVRCLTGDLDLDLESMTTSAGSIVAMSHGPVRLRGAYAAAGDVQVISLADTIDVRGATLSTNDAAVGPSGFVRAASYAATTIDAADATISTGDSDARSGDVLLQTDERGAAPLEGVLEVSSVGARRLPDGVVTTIRGTIGARGLHKIRFDGSARFSADDLTRRLILRGSGRGNRLEGASDVVNVRLTRAGKSRARFVLTVVEPGAVQEGAETSLEIARAGLNARGKFKRPRVRGK